MIYREGKEKAYKESSVDDKYVENLTSPFYAVMSAKVNEVVDGDNKKVDNNDGKDNSKIPKSSFYEEFFKLSEKFTMNDDIDNSVKSNENVTNASSSPPLKRRQGSVNNRINYDNKSSGIVGDYIDNFLESRNENLSPSELANRKKILEERIFKRDKNLLEAFNTADKAKEYVENYTNNNNNNNDGGKNDNDNKKMNLDRINGNNNKIVEGESDIKNELNGFLSTSSRNEILNHINYSNSSINTKNDNVVKNLNRGTSVFLALEEELIKFKKAHFDTYNPEKDSNEKIIEKKNVTSTNFNSKNKYQNNRILSTTEKNELYEKELLQNKKITNEFIDKGEEMVFSYSDYLISKSKSLLPFNFPTGDGVIKNRKKDLRSNNRK